MWAIALIGGLMAVLGIAFGFIFLVAAIIAFSKDAKRRNSLRHDVCRHCGYHVGTLDRCPECGLNSPTRT